MKRIFSAAAAIIFSILTFSGVYATSGEAEAPVMISQIELVNYVIFAGIGIFLIGMIFVLLSIRKGAEISELPEDETEDDEQPVEENSEEQPKEPEEEEGGTAEAAEAVEEEAREEEPETEEESETEPEEEEEPEPEPEEEEEPEPEPEPEPEEKKVRITLMGTNNSDVKIAEFAKPITLGRRGENDIIISDNAVSGKHCEFSYEGGAVYIKDLNSTNGTLVNGELIEFTELKNGDMIIVGKHQYKVGISE